MILAIEIAFLIAGVYAIFTAKMPSWIIGKGYKAEGNLVRLLGVFMAALLPGIFCAGLSVGFIAAANEFDPSILATLVEIGTVVLAAIVVTIILRRIRVPDVPEQQNPMSISDNKPE